MTNITRTRTDHTSKIWKGPDGRGCIPRDEKTKPRRFADGFDPVTTHRDSVAERKHNLRGLTDDALKRAITYFEARIEDSKTGPDRNLTIERRATQQLALAKAELATRNDLGDTEEGRLHRLDSRDLDHELDTQLDRLRQATTPEDEAKARAEVAKLEHELGVRQDEQRAGGELPELARVPIFSREERARSSFVDGLRTASDAELKKEIAGRKALLKDSSTGAAGSKGNAANASTDLQFLQDELALRKSLAGGAQPAFALRAHREPREALESERTRVADQLKTAENASPQDPKEIARLGDRLGIIDAELARRPEEIVG